MVNILGGILVATASRFSRNFSTDEKDQSHCPLCRGAWPSDACVCRVSRRDRREGGHARSADAGVRRGWPFQSGHQKTGRPHSAGPGVRGRRHAGGLCQHGLSRFPRRAGRPRAAAGPVHPARTHPDRCDTHAQRARLLRLSQRQGRHRRGPRVSRLRLQKGR